MSWEADRLVQSAGELRRVARELREHDNAARSLVSSRVMHGQGSWHSETARAFLQRTEDRSGRLRAAADRLDALAGDMERRAEQLRQEEQRRREEDARRAAQGRR